VALGLWGTACATTSQGNANRSIYEADDSRGGMLVCRKEDETAEAEVPPTHLREVLDELTEYHGYSTSGCTFTPDESMNEVDDSRGGMLECRNEKDTVRINEVGPGGLDEALGVVARGGGSWRQTACSRRNAEASCPLPF